MEPATRFLMAGFLLAIGASLLAVYRLREARSDRPRNVAIVFLLVVIALDASYIVSLSMVGTSAGYGGVILAGLLQFTGSAVLVHLATAFTGLQRLRSWNLFIAMVYTPVLFVIALMGWFYHADPSSFTVTWESGISDTVYGIMNPVMLAFGTLYILGVMYKLSWMLLRGARIIRTETLLVLFFTSISLFVYFLPTRLAPGLSSWSVSLLSSSMVALALSYAAFKKSPLIVPTKEECTGSQVVGSSFSSGCTYLYLHRSRGARSAFATFVKSGKEGLWITRRNPAEGRTGYALVRTPFVWLTATNVPGEICVNPAETSRLSKAIMDFIGAAKDFIILFEGLEYMVSVSGFGNTLNLIQFINDQVMGRQGVLLLSLDPGVLKHDELAMLRSEAVVALTDAVTQDRDRNIGAASRPARPGAPKSSLGQPRSPCAD